MESLAGWCYFKKLHAWACNQWQVFIWDSNTERDTLISPLMFHLLHSIQSIINTIFNFFTTMGHCGDGLAQMEFYHYQLSPVWLWMALCCDHFKAKALISHNLHKYTWGTAGFVFELDTLTCTHTHMSSLISSNKTSCQTLMVLESFVCTQHTHAHACM